MLKPRVIPCLDVRNGRVVKGIKFQNLRDAGDPAELAARYEADGADELVLLDVSATIEDRTALVQTIRDVRHQLSIPLTVGGGITSTDDARVLLGSGADKISLNSAAVKRPALIEEMAQQFGAQCTVVAIDAARDTDPAQRNNGWQVVTRSGTERNALDAIDWARSAEQLGAGEILLTSWDRDGTRLGYDLELLRHLTQAVSIPVIASGGANSAKHLKQALDAGAHAVLAASIFHDGNASVVSVKNQLRQLGVEVRI